MIYLLFDGIHFVCLFLFGVVMKEWMVFASIAGGKEDAKLFIQTFIHINYIYRPCKLEV